jgi:hypothetical protein
MRRIRSNTQTGELRDEFGPVSVHDAPLRPGEGNAGVDFEQDLLEESGHAAAGKGTVAGHGPGEPTAGLEPVERGVDRVGQGNVGRGIVSRGAGCEPHNAEEKEDGSFHTESRTGGENRVGRVQGLVRGRTRTSS